MYEVATIILQTHFLSEEIIRKLLETVRYTGSIPQHNQVFDKIKLIRILYFTCSDYYAFIFSDYTITPYT